MNAQCQIIENDAGNEFVQVQERHGVVVVRIVFGITVFFVFEDEEYSRMDSVPYKSFAKYSP